MNRIMRGVIRCFIQIAAVTLLIVGIRICTDGMWLLGLPDLKEIQTVSISYPEVTDESREISSPEDMELALKLTGFLNYDVFKKADSEEEPVITIVYHMKNGTDKVISANDTTVWWNGKSHTIKDQEIFVNLTEGIFFSKESRTE